MAKKSAKSEDLSKKPAASQKAYMPRVGVLENGIVNVYDGNTCSWLGSYPCPGGSLIASNNVDSFAVVAPSPGDKNGTLYVFSVHHFPFPPYHDGVPNNPQSMLVLEEFIYIGGDRIAGFSIGDSNIYGISDPQGIPANIAGSVLCLGRSNRSNKYLYAIIGNENSTFLVLFFRNNNGQLTYADGIEMPHSNGYYMPVVSDAPPDENFDADYIYCAASDQSGIIGYKYVLTVPMGGLQPLGYVGSVPGRAGPAVSTGAFLFFSCSSYPDGAGSNMISMFKIDESGSLIKLGYIECRDEIIALDGNGGRVEALFRNEGFDRYTFDSDGMLSPFRSCPATLISCMGGIVLELI